MDLVVPVDDHGRQTDYAGKYAGMKTEESNAVILADLKEKAARCSPPRNSPTATPTAGAARARSSSALPAVVLLRGVLQGRGRRRL